MESIEDAHGSPARLVKAALMDDSREFLGSNAARDDRHACPPASLRRFRTVRARWRPTVAEMLDTQRWHENDAITIPLRE